MEMCDIDFFSHTRRVPIPEEEEVGIENYNSKENRKILRELEGNRRMKESLEE
jgi:hypothetical protein